MVRLQISISQKDISKDVTKWLKISPIKSLEKKETKICLENRSFEI